MDIRKILHLSPKQPVFEGDSGQAPHMHEFEIANTSDLRTRVAEDIAQISPTVLDRAGAARESLGLAPDERQPRNAGNRLGASETSRHESQTSDLMKHMLGGLSDGRVRRVMKERRQHAKGKPSSRQAA